MDPRTASPGPERTCVGCHTKAPRDRLVRLVRVIPDAAAPFVRWDPSGSAPGRGAWLHPDAHCLDLALRRGGLARSFRGRVEVEGLQELRDHLETTHPPSRKRVEEPMDIR